MPKLFHQKKQEKLSHNQSNLFHTLEKNYH